MPIIERQTYDFHEAILFAEAMDKFGVRIVSVMPPDVATKGYWRIIGQRDAPLPYEEIDAEFESYLKS